MNKTYLWLAAIVVMLIGVHLDSNVTVHAQSSSSRCVANVPRDWGNFKGVSQAYGIGFEDSSGTLRFMNQFPCGLDHAPIVSLEIRRP